MTPGTRTHEGASLRIETWQPKGMSDKDGERLRMIVGLRTNPESRRKKLAQWLMCEVCVEANQTGTVLVLEPNPDEDCPLDAGQLKSWYRRFGFQDLPNPGGVELMARVPR